MTAPSVSRQFGTEIVIRTAESSVKVKPERPFNWEGMFGIEKGSRKARAGSLRVVRRFERSATPFSSNWTWELDGLLKAENSTSM